MTQVKRNVNGVLLLDKPAGMSSNHALQAVKRILSAKKAGHTGSLDPIATGLLPICFGEMTKFSQYLLDSDKSYQVSASLGQTTSTGDIEGEVLQTRDVPPLDEKHLLSLLKDFTGEQLQVPPMYSALKHQGRPLYELARKGIEVERKQRQITIYDIELVSFDSDTIVLNVSCSKGTYIRTLVEDIGERLGCGAHVAALRRTQVGPYRALSDALTLDQLQALVDEKGLEVVEQRLLGADSMLMSWPKIILTHENALSLHRGQPIRMPRTPQSGQVKLVLENERFFGIGEIGRDGKVRPKRLLQNIPRSRIF